MIKENLESCLLVWARPYKDSDFQEMATKITNCNKLTDAFLDGKLPFQAFLDLMQTEGVDMDSYEETVTANLETFGFL